MLILARSVYPPDTLDDLSWVAHEGEEVDWSETKEETSGTKVLTSSSRLQGQAEGLICSKIWGY